MQLAITLLGRKPSPFMPDVIAVINACKCNILEFTSSRFPEATEAAYLLVEGNWNCLAKLENNLEHLQKRLDIQINSLHIESPEKLNDSIPYNLETIAIHHEDIIQDMMAFLATHHVIVAEMKCSCYPALYSQTPLLSIKFVILIPANIQLISFREELLSFCDNYNVDAIFEPIRR